MKKLKIMVSLLLALLFLFACGKGSTTSVGDGAYAVFGTITSVGAALSGATVTLSGTSSGVTSTAANGNYTVTPTLAG